MLDILSYLLGKNEGSGGGGGGGGGSTPVESKDVDFIDYDGTIVASYTADEFLALSAMPDNPSHDRLVAQGWNWTLADAQAYVAECGGLIIGQEYVTASGKTEIVIKPTVKQLSLYLGLYLNGSVTIDWGDGSATETMTGSGALRKLPHTYSTPDVVYTITIEGAHRINGNNYTTNASYLISSSSSTSGTSSNDMVISSCVKAVFCAANATVSGYAFCGMAGLEKVTLPPTNTIYSMRMFSGCDSLKTVSIPHAATMNNPSYVFYETRLLQSVSLPKALSNIGSNAFYQSALSTFFVPSSVTSIPASILSYCARITSVVIPSGVTTIASSAFEYTSNLYVFKFTSQTPPTLSGSSALGKTTGLVIYVPSGSLSAYTSATNYPSSATNTYIEY